LVELLKVVDKVSQNLHAELMLREAARVARHFGTRESGIDELLAWLLEIGVEKDDVRFEDGSGLARNTLVTPRAVTRLLAYMWQSPHRDAWVDLMPIGGVDGTLQRRFQGAAEASAIRAKTGSLSRALALSGYAESKTLGPLAFSLIINNYTASQSEVRRWIDKMALALLE
jgi:D-alanyl-D-alanine carboxypeptidase/D-alanyl-D-alanine-endopeptidase (penicillin-binding protein 4)